MSSLFWKACFALTIALDCTCTMAQTIDDQPHWVPKEKCDPGDYTGIGEMVGCVSRHIEEADREMNRLYQVQLQYLTESANQKNFRAAQRAWLKFRDAECVYQADDVGALFYEARRLDLTMKRVRDLEDDVACRGVPCPD